MVALSETEQACLQRYCDHLCRELADPLLAIILVGSAARGDMWPADSPMHSDIDLVVVTDRSLDEATRGRLLEPTYELFLQCGRQISPQWLEQRRLREPRTDLERAFSEHVNADGVLLWQRPE